MHAGTLHPSTTHLPAKYLAAASRRLLSRHNIWNSFAVSRFNHSLAGPYVSVSLGQREYMTMEFFLMFPAQISIFYPEMEPAFPPFPRGGASDLAGNITRANFVIRVQ